MAALSKCPRCGELFSRGELPVCGTCWPDEHEDYERVRDIMDFRPGLTALELADEAEVTFDVVSRMLDTGHIKLSDGEEPARCGCCGAPAISESKRLCQACLVKLDQACAKALSELRTRMSGYAGAGANRVHDVFTLKRSGLAVRRHEAAFSLRSAVLAGEDRDEARMYAARTREVRYIRAGREG